MHHEVAKDGGRFRYGPGYYITCECCSNTLMNKNKRQVIKDWNNPDKKGESYQFFEIYNKISNNPEFWKAIRMIIREEIARNEKLFI